MKRSLLLFILCILLFLSSCTINDKTKYYSEPSNYITAIGTVIHIQYNKQTDALYIGMDQLSPEFSDNSFKIVGKNLAIVLENGIEQKLQPGQQIEFISAPKYFGDGYIMPIVAITVDDEVLLDFEHGYTNWLEWLSQKNIKR